MISSLFLSTSWAVHVSVGVCHRPFCYSDLSSPESTLSPTQARAPPRRWAFQPRRRVLAVGRALSKAASAWAAVLAAPHGLLRPLSEVLVAQELRLGLTISQISR